MKNPPGLLTSSKSREYQCQECTLIFDSQKGLQSHKAKFCMNSKYGDLQVLQKQFKQKSKGRDISLYGKASLINFNQNKNLGKQLNQLHQNSSLLGINSVLKNNNSILLDKQYQSVLDELTNKQSLKKKLQRQKNQAYQELQHLEKRQNDLLIDTKQDQLHEVLKRRKQLQEEEKQIQDQMRIYQTKKKEMQKDIQLIDKQDYIYKEARYAGKLAKQRQMLEQKKKQMEHNLRQKRRQRDEIQHKLDQSKAEENQIFVPPDFRKNKQQKKLNRKVISASNPSFKTPEDSLDSLSFQNTNRNETKQNINNNYQSMSPPSYPNQNVGIQHWPEDENPHMQNYQSPLKRSTAEIFNLPHQKYSDPLRNKNEQNDDQYPYFTPQKFSKNQKLLTDMLNRNGKSEEDLFIQQLNAQQFDSLNLLTKIPKGSELYQIKLKQFQQLSKLRDDYKKQAHQKRVQKMKRQFEYEKKVMEKEMQNALWVDQNRKLMLAQQINIVKNQQQWEKDKQLLGQQARLQQANQRASNPIQQSELPPFNPNINNPYSLNNKNPPSNQQIRGTNSNIPQNSNENLQNKTNNPYENYMNNMGNRTASQEGSSGKTNRMGGVLNQESSNQYNNQYPNHLQNQLPNQNPQHYNTQNMRLSQNQGQSSPYLWGYKVSIEALKNYVRSKPIRIKIIVKQHDVTQNLSQNSPSILKYQFLTSYHYEKIRSQEASFNQNMNNKYDKTKTNVLYKQDFLVQVNLQELYNKRQNQLYLFIFAQEKDQTKLSNEPTIYGWYNMKITHFGQIKQGKFTLNLYSDPSTYPVPSDMNKKKYKLKQQIVVELNQVVIEKAKPPPKQSITQQAPYQPPEIIKTTSGKSLNSVRMSNQANQNAVNNTQSSAFSNISKRNVQNPNSQTSILNNQMNNTQMNNTKKSSIRDQPNFIPNQFETQFVKTTLKQPKNFDITLTQLRTLPSYTGVVKIQMSFIDSAGKQVLPKEQILSEMGTSDMYNPLINYVRTIRNQKLMTPTTVIFIRFLAINAIDYEIYNLGFTVFYMFFNQDTQPCTSNDIKDFYVSTGYYQLPIFWGNLQPQYVKMQDLVDKFPLIPCVSLLMGCTINSGQQTTKIPRYGQKVYNTLLFDVQQKQLRLFDQQYKRQKLDANKILKGYLKHKGINSNYSSQQTKNYLFKAMTFSKDNTENMFPLEYMAEYTPYFGLLFSIDKLQIPKTEQNYYYFITVCLSPQAKYYTSKQKDLEDLIIVYQILPEESNAYEIIYASSQIFIQPKYDINSCFIIQFKRIKIGKQNQISPNIESYGHVIVPIFKEIQGIRCTNVMKDTVNTYSGPFNLNGIKELKKNLPEYLDKLIQSVQPSEIQLTFRLLNGYFTQQYQKQKPIPAKNRKSSYFKWYSRPIDFQDARKKVKLVIQRKYGLSL